MSEMTMQRPIVGGTDGFRGIATDEPGPGQMNQETIAVLTHSLVESQMEAGAGNICVVGRDTRPSGPELEEAAVAGARVAGATVVRLGVAPTPAILKIAQALNAGSAVGITASHNPAEYNGWKGTLGEHKPVGPQVKAISDRYWRAVDSGLVVPVDAGADVKEIPGLLEDYKRAVVLDVQAEFGERPLEGKIFVVDTANGAAMNVTPDVLRRLGATVEEFACDGSSLINEGCGAADLEGVKNFLRSRPDLVLNPNFVGALANDGDADRMIGLGATILPDGQMVFEEMEGNRVMELQAQGQPGIIGTDYTNDAMIARLQSQGIGFEFCENGDANVTAALRAKQAAGQDWTRGGEFTGHHIDLKWLSSGDGVRMAAWLASYAAKKNTNFFVLAESMPLWPESMIKVKLPKGANPKEIMQRTGVVRAIEEARIALDGIGRTHVRPSGTEPLIRSWVVGQDRELVDITNTRIATAIKGALV